MPNPNVTTQTGSTQSSVPDTQALIALLSSLMPLLQRMQIQIGAMPAPPFTHTQSNFAPANLFIQNPLIDQQAAVAFIEDITADTLRNLSGYLEAHAEQHGELERCVGLVTQAARCFAAREYAQAFELIWQAYRVVAAARAANPQLPPVRAVGAPGASFQSSTPMAH
jgi:hypothetical protein